MINWGKFKYILALFMDLEMILVWGRNWSFNFFQIVKYLPICASWWSPTPSALSHCALNCNVAHWIYFWIQKVAFNLNKMNASGLFFSAIVGSHPWYPRNEKERFFLEVFKVALQLLAMTSFGNWGKHIGKQISIAMFSSRMKRTVQ